MKIGNIDLGPRPVTLAPMEDVTDASFRILCREAGTAMVTTEFVSSDGLVRDVAKTIAKMHTLEEEAPVAVQIYGSIPEAMVDAARMAANAKELAGGHGADIVDINFGCPVSKIAGRGAGSGMMKYPDKMVAITKAIVEAVPDARRGLCIGLQQQDFADGAGWAGWVAGGTYCADIQSFMYNPLRKKRRGL